MVSIVTLISVLPVDIWSITSPLTDIFLIKWHWFEPHLPNVSLFHLSFTHNDTRSHTNYTKHTKSPRKPLKFPHKWKNLIEMKILKGRHTVYHSTHSISMQNLPEIWQVHLLDLLAFIRPNVQGNNIKDRQRHTDKWENWTLPPATLPYKTTRDTT